MRLITLGLIVQGILGTLLTLPGGAAAAANPNSIVPGRSIGVVRLGEDERQVEQQLGPPNDGEGAMMKEWHFWYSRKSAPKGRIRNELDVYESMVGEGRHTAVGDIRVTSPSFQAPGAISTGCNLRQIHRQYKHARAIAHYSSRQLGGEVTIYDDRPKGIAFEVWTGKKSGPIANGQCVAIWVHQKGADITTYLPLQDYKMIRPPGRKP